MSANEAARDLIQQSKDFHNYAFEAMRVIRALQIKIFLQVLINDIVTYICYVLIFLLSGGNLY